MRQNKNTTTVLLVKHDTMKENRQKNTTRLKIWRINYQGRSCRKNKST